MKMIQRLKTFVPERIVEKQFIQELERIHNWHVVSEAGSGSYGKAYIILQKEKGSSFVLKRLRKRKWRSKDALQAFQLEQKILQTLDHAAFPRFYSSGEMLGIPYFIMERKYGHTLEEVLFDKNEVYSEEQTFHLAGKLLGIIVHMHQNGIVHRDIRIPNVLLHQNSISVIDFGLGSFIETEEYDLNLHPKQSKTYISDLYGLGHFLLFLLYSSYEADNSSGSGWEEELTISKQAKEIIKKLLSVKEPYTSSEEALEHVKKHIRNYRGNKNDVIQ
ncbi:serine/threonine protein kinase [Peribacillus deserti]|uniref:Serine/threonine protein kinase n=1 Tax=Peribacillus deserti TaxID=673318 RepID=A0A2N5M2Y6_9BACI|nr:protein kinase family protein [Peribacillus deserti]PLT28717.1 serine/threonine protein kinase [Peribacillus deserti]